MAIKCRKNHKTEMIKLSLFPFPDQGGFYFAFKMKFLFLIPMPHLLLRLYYP